MAFYDGSANSFADLQAALVAACVAEGWAWANGVLSKGAAYVAPTSHASNGISIQGATGVGGGVLVNPSGVRPRMGRPSNFGQQPTWPMSYSIHIHDEPDEVFFFARFGVDFFYFLAFGLSDVPGLDGTGLWLTASSRQQVGDFIGQDGMVLGPDSGGIGNDRQSVGMPFWDSTRYTNNNLVQDTAHALGGWADQNVGAFNAVQYASPHIARSPNAWNSEGVLLPIQVYQAAAESKVRLVIEVRHARYLRIDNYEPEDIITLGADRWKVYPGYRKNSAARDSGGQATGTFGWCIRYDGP